MISLRAGELEAPQEGPAVTAYWTLEKLTALDGKREGLLCSIQNGYTFSGNCDMAVWVLSSLYMPVWL